VIRIRSKAKHVKHLVAVERQIVDTCGMTDVTDRAVAAGWTLPQGWRVVAWSEHDSYIGDPREHGDVYCTDVDEQDYSHPTRAFCIGCDAWIHELDEQAVAGILATLPEDTDEDDLPWVGGWSAAATGTRCRDSHYGRHQPNDPLSVRWWREDKWEFVTVTVAVVDEQDQQWGLASLGGTEAGLFPTEINADTGDVTSAWIDPVNDPHHPVPDLISEAMHEAAEELRSARRARRPHVRVWRWLRAFPWRAGQRLPRIVAPRV
jgi:hypothetical protein